MTTMPLRPAAASSPINDALAPFATRFAALITAFRGRRAANELATLDDHLLADIGLTRGEVAGALERSMFEDPTLPLAAAARARRTQRWL